MNTFIGVDLGWYGKPSGLASIRLEGSALRLCNIARLESTDEILGWIQTEAGSGSAVAAVDAPLIIRNRAGIRPAERELNADFRRFHAGCHAANLGRPFAQNVISFSRRLEALGFRHGASMSPRQEGRFQIEVHPHAATVALFGLDRIVKYKRGTRAATSPRASPSSSSGNVAFACARSSSIRAPAASAENRQPEANRRSDRRGALRLHRCSLVDLGNPAKQFIRQSG